MSRDKGLTKKDLGVCFNVPMQKYFALLVEDTQIHSLCVKIDSTVKFVLLGVKSHKGLLLRNFIGT